MKPAFLVWNVLACASAMVGGCALIADYDFGAYAERPPGEGGGAAQGGGGSGGDGGSASITTSGPGTGGGGGSGASGGGETTLYLLHTTEDPLQSLAVDEDHVYWTTSPTIDPTGTVERVDKRGEGHLTLAMNLDSPGGIRVDGMAVYWYSGSLANSQIRRWEKASSMATLLYSFNGGMLALAGWDQWLYFSHGHTIFRMEADGGTATGIIYPSKVASSIAADATGVYWVDRGMLNSYDSEIWRANLDGSSPTRLAELQDFPFTIATDADKVYWGTAHGGVLSTRKDGTEAVFAHVAPADSNTIVSGVVSDGKHVYYTYRNQVLRTPIEEANPSEVFTYVRDLENIARDGSDLYIITRGSEGDVLKLSNLPP